MNIYIPSILQLAVGLSVIYVWVFRYDNVVLEFKQFGLSDITRNAVGASKTILSTLLIVGIWKTDLVFLSAILMGGFMLAAQYFHFKVNNPLAKRIPSLVFLFLSAIIALNPFQYLK